MTQGSIELVLVEIPWSRLSSKSVKVSIKGVHVRLESVNDGKDSPSSTIPLQSASSLLIAQNSSRLKTRLLTHSPIFDDEKSLSTDTTDNSFGARLVRRVLENLDVSVLDVSLSVLTQRPTGSHSFGVSLHSLGLFSTDDSDNRCFVDRKR